MGCILNKNLTHATSLKDAMHSYHLLVFEHAHHYPTVAGILLFGKNTHYFFEQAIILCSHFSGTEGREAIASKECSGTIIDQYHEAYDFILSRLNYSFTIKGKVRSEVLEVPEVAVREILVNALVHRNYNIKAPIKVAIYQDRLM
ncbi:MAG: hypothetical protein KC505_10680 [Myxococcales bacterium]|nr:hypothetical protein [Myxococcales bacterium]